MSESDYKTALELIASGFPDEEFDGASEQVERAERVAREALGWHWHVTFKDWRDSSGVGIRTSDGSTSPTVFHKSISVPLYDDMPPLFFDENEAEDYARNIRSDAVHCATRSRDGEDLMAARSPGGIMLPRVARQLSAFEYNEARARVDAKVVDCRDPNCSSFRVMRQREENAAFREERRREAAEKKRKDDEEHEREWREGDRARVRGWKP